MRLASIVLRNASALLRGPAKPGLAISFTAAALSAVAVPAVAQPSTTTSPYYQPAPAARPVAPTATYRLPPRRVGWELDVGLQAGTINCEDEDGRCGTFDGAGGVNIGGTYMFTPRLGINGQLWVMAHTEDDWTLSQFIGSVGVELRPVPILSLDAGIGVAHAALSSDRYNVAIRSDDAPAIYLGAGLELVRARTWALDVHVKFGAGFYGDENDDGEADVVARNVGVGVGLTWF